MESTIHHQNVPQTSSSGRTFKVIFQVLVGLQAALAAVVAVGAIYVIAQTSGSTDDWAGLGLILGWALLVVSGLALAWYGMMLFSSFRSNTVPAVMGIVQGALFMAPTLTNMAGNGGLIGSTIPLVVGGGWIWLCSTYRKWPDPS